MNSFAKFVLAAMCIFISVSCILIGDKNSCSFFICVSTDGSLPKEPKGDVSSQIAGKTYVFGFFCKARLYPCVCWWCKRGVYFTEGGGSGRSVYFKRNMVCMVYFYMHTSRPKPFYRCNVDLF